MINTYQSLVLSGGGPKGIIQLGMLNVYHHLGELDNIQNYVGTSIGSVISLLFGLWFHTNGNF